jgi:putative transposase
LAEDLQRCIEGLALRRPRRSLAGLHRLAATVAREHNWPAPRPDRSWGLARRFDPALGTLAPEGPKATGKRFDLFHRRESERPNAVWKADHTELHLWLVDEHGQAVRLWLTEILDEDSRTIPGYFLSFAAPSTDATEGPWG